MKYYLPIKGNEGLIHAPACISLKTSCMYKNQDTEMMNGCRGPALTKTPLVRVEI